VTTPFARDTLRKIEPSLLRAVMRERTHHSFEYILYRAIFGGGKLSEGAITKVEEILALCRERGLSPDLADMRWAQTLLDLAKALRAGTPPRVAAERPAPFDAHALATVDALLFGRRSIRLWTDDPVPERLIERVIDAGLWAPHACNLQNTRVIIVSKETAKQLLPGGETRGAAVYLVICRDLRAYEHYAATVPLHNRGLDAGAAVQNMLLMAHALGLGAVWGTFDDPIALRIRKHFNVPVHIELITYLGLGWPAEAHIAPGRLAVEDAVVARG